MDAKKSALSIGDYLCLIARKYFRLAIPLYLMWVLLWCLNSRLFSGPIWNNTNVVYEECSALWWPTFLFLGNIVPGEMYPYKGCL